MDAVLNQLIEVLESAQQRKSMYFSPISPESVNHWLHGLRVGLSFCGVEWSTELRRQVVERRGLEFTAAGEVEQLVQRGLTSEAVVDELLALEIDMWKLQRSEQLE